MNEFLNKFLKGRTHSGGRKKEEMDVQQLEKLFEAFLKDEMESGGALVRFEFLLRRTDEGISIKSRHQGEAGAIALADELGISKDEIAEIFSNARKEFSNAIQEVSKRITKNLKERGVEFYEERRNCSKNCGH